MKNLFFIAVMIAAVVSAACGKNRVKQDNSKLQEIVDMLNADEEANGDYPYVASIRGNDILLTMVFDESELSDGITVQNMADMMKGVGDQFYILLVNESLDFTDEKDRMLITTLRENKSNLIFHCIGKQSREEGEFVIPYYLLLESTSTASVNKSEERDYSTLQALVGLVNADVDENGYNPYVASLRGNDFVLTQEFDESGMPEGVAFKDVVDMIEAGGDQLYKSLIDTMFTDTYENNRVLKYFLRKNKANIIIHLIGNQSREEAEFFVRYDLLPEYTLIGSDNASDNQNNPTLQALADLINADENTKECIASVRGNDIVFTMIFDESELMDGLTVENVAQLLEFAGDQWYISFINESFKDIDENNRTVCNILRENKSNMIFHLIGNQSREEGEFVIPYDLLPE